MKALIAAAALALLLGTSAVAAEHPRDIGVETLPPIPLTPQQEAEQRADSAAQEPRAPRNVASGPYREWAQTIAETIARLARYAEESDISEHVVAYDAMGRGYGVTLPPLRGPEAGTRLSIVNTPDGNTSVEIDCRRKRWRAVYPYTLWSQGGGGQVGDYFIAAICGAPRVLP